MKKNKTLVLMAVLIIIAIVLIILIPKLNKNSKVQNSEEKSEKYVYTFGLPYEYIYTVTNKNACKSVVKEKYLKYGNSEKDAEEYATSVCDNSADIYKDGTNYSTNDWLQNNFNFEQISSFVNKKRGEITNVKNTYDELIDENGNLYNVFIRWKENTKKFDEKDEKELCITKNTNDVKSYEIDFDKCIANSIPNVSEEDMIKYCQGNEITNKKISIAEDVKKGLAKDLEQTGIIKNIVYKKEFTCFKSNNYDNESSNAKTFFNNNCMMWSGEYLSCNNSSYMCDFYTNGKVLCRSSKEVCSINNGIVDCSKN